MQDQSRKESQTSGPDEVKPPVAGSKGGDSQRDTLKNGHTRLPSDSDQYGSRSRPDGDAYSDHDVRDNSPQL